jgi:phage N-6-adenine-methyltransferase
MPSESPMRFTNRLSLDALPTSTVSASELMARYPPRQGVVSRAADADFAAFAGVNPTPVISGLDLGADPAEDLTPGEESRAYIPRAVRSDWRTPDSVLAVVRNALGGEVGLDPCASTTHWLAGGEEIGVLNFHEEDDALAIDWEASIRADGAPRTVFVNPPFNRNRDWVKKCAEEAAKGLEVILLIPARTDTRYWQSHIAETSQAICFWKGRITFVGGTNSAPFPCAFVYWGPRASWFDSAFNDYGQVLFTGNTPVTESGNV